MPGQFARVGLLGVAGEAAVALAARAPLPRAGGRPSRRRALGLRPAGRSPLGRVVRNVARRPIWCCSLDHTAHRLCERMGGRLFSTAHWLCGKGRADLLLLKLVDWPMLSVRAYLDQTPHGLVGGGALQPTAPQPLPKLGNEFSRRWCSPSGGRRCRRRR